MELSPCALEQAYPRFESLCSLFADATFLYAAFYRQVCDGIVQVVDNGVQHHVTGNPCTIHGCICGLQDIIDDGNTAEHPEKREIIVSAVEIAFAQEWLDIVLDSRCSSFPDQLVSVADRAIAAVPVSVLLWRH